MKLTVCTRSEKGGRSANEDAAACRVSGGRGVFLLADGLGGHRGGGLASRITADSMADGLCRRLEAGEPLTPALLRQTFLEANALLLDRQRDPGPPSMMTTAVALAVWDGAAVWGHVGDSRLYRFEGGLLTGTTRDHSVTYKKYLSGEITLEQIGADEDRGSLLAAMGSRERCRPELPPASHAVSPGDAFLLCTDGLWEYLSAGEITADLKRSAAPGEWAALLMARREARAAAASDNYSLITIFAQ